MANYSMWQEEGQWGLPAWLGKPGHTAIQYPG